jgi:hypothetical protein
MEPVMVSILLFNEEDKLVALIVNSLIYPLPFVSVIDVVIPRPPAPITSNASEPVALNIDEPDTNISLKCEPIDMNAVPVADSLTFNPVSESKCNFVNVLSD